MPITNYQVSTINDRLSIDRELPTLALQRSTVNRSRVPDARTTTIDCQLSIVN
ncbi:MAG: hypothetical protein ACRC62_39825 [Microcoleus sp.]